MFKHLRFTVAVASLLMCNALAFAGNDPETPTSLAGAKVVNAAEAKALLGKAHFFDMRKAVSFGKGHLPGAKPLPFKQKSEKTPNFDASLDSFDASQLPADKNAKIVFYSDGPTGWKSYKAAAMSVKRGYRNVHWLRGGSKEWEGAGYQLEQ